MQRTVDLSESSSSSVEQTWLVVQCVDKAGLLAEIAQLITAHAHNIKVLTLALFRPLMSNVAWCLCTRRGGAAPLATNAARSLRRQAFMSWLKLVHHAYARNSH